jgi:hypothetical protein
MIDILKVKKDDIIKFNKHFHFIINDQLNFSNQIGKVVSTNNNEVIIKLKKHFPDLLDWNNCLVFSSDEEEGDFYEGVKVSILGKANELSWWKD